MNLARWSQHLAAALLLTVLTSSLVAQVPASSGPELPSSFRLADVTIGLVEGGGTGGCVGRCNVYRITIHGDGAVTCEDIGTAPRADVLRRTVPVDEIVSLVNEFLRVRFFEARDRYDTVTFVERKGDLLVRRNRGGIDGGTSDITITLGPRTKTVVLSENYPAELGRLRDLIWRMGGPQAWAAK